MSAAFHSRICKRVFLGGGGVILVEAGSLSVYFMTDIIQRGAFFLTVEGQKEAVTDVNNRSA